MKFTIVRSREFRDHMLQYMKTAAAGEPVFISRTKKQDTLVLISKDMFDSMMASQEVASTPISPEPSTSHVTGKYLDDLDFDDLEADLDDF